MRASAGDAAGVAEALSDGGASVDDQDDDGCTALHWAADRGHLRVCEPQSWPVCTGVRQLLAEGPAHKATWHIMVVCAAYCPPSAYLMMCIGAMSSNYLHLPRCGLTCLPNLTCSMINQMYQYCLESSCSIHCVKLLLTKWLWLQLQLVLSRGLWKS